MLTRQRLGHPHRLGHGGVALGAGDGADLDHFVQNDVGAGGGALALGHRRIARGRLQKTRQQGGFADRQLVGALVEIALRGGFDAIGAGAEIDAVQVEGEDLLLGELHFQPHGQHQLLNLALHVLIGRQEQVLGQLLGDGRAALDHAPGLQVRGHGAAHADRVETGVVVEAAVLDGHEGGRDVVGQGVQIDGRRHLGAAHRDQGAGAVQVGDRGLAIDLIQTGGVGQVAREDGEEDDGEDQAPDGQHRAPVEQPSHDGPARLSSALIVPVGSAVFARHEHPFSSSGVNPSRSRRLRKRPRFQ
ncbi:hypothetical protein D3C73_697120 [compost metagenome]